MAEKTKLHVVEVVRKGEQIIIPDKMTIPEALIALQKRGEYEEQLVSISEDADAFVWDGALAMQKAIVDLFGWSDAMDIPSFFGKTPPKMIKVDTGIDTSVLVPWGRFGLPNISGWVQTGYKMKNEMAIFSVQAEVKRKDEARVRALMELTRKYCKEESIYKGHAIRIKFYDENGEKMPLPEPEFIDTRKVNVNEIVFSSLTSSAIATSVFTPIEHSEWCRKHGIPLKRGILLAGDYGVGKTLVSSICAKKSEENKWTFLMCAQANEVADMVHFARKYQPAVVFCEDIDRTVSGDRSEEMDEILNTIDGIESKGTEIMVVLTTNHPEKINKAMLRPGRLDAVVTVEPPDAAAVEKLIRLYGRGLVLPTEDLKSVGKALANHIPAIIREVVERSKLYAIRTTGDKGKLVVTSKDLLEAAETMKSQLALLNADNISNTETIKDAIVKLSNVSRSFAKNL